MLTPKDLKNIQDLTRVAVKEEIEEALKNLPTKDDIKHLPTKEEFYKKMDEVVGELQKTRDEQVILGGQVSDHIDRIESLEKIHPNGTHASR